MKPHLSVLQATGRVVLTYPHLPRWRPRMIAPVWVVRVPAVFLMLKGPSSYGTCRCVLQRFRFLKLHILYFWLPQIKKQSSILCLLSNHTGCAPTWLNEACALDACDDGKGVVDDISVDEAPRIIISESIPDCFLLGSVPILDNIISFIVVSLFCQLGRPFWVLLLTWLKWVLGWSPPCNFSKDVT